MLCLELQAAGTGVDARNHAIDASQILAIRINIVPTVHRSLPLVDRATRDHFADDLADNIIQSHMSHFGPPVRIGW